ncbi:hypothetical protein ACJIZ3_003643 [Penstemon smallii]|uniref:Uncharacterized protein n=1 Tax=Penstemon smallii TaxID=265156 RepID=A0ABD3UBB3_9LAMI
MNNSESKNQLKVEIKCKAINVRQKIDHIIRHEVVSKSLKHRPTLGDHKAKPLNSKQIASCFLSSYQSANSLISVCQSSATSRT